jgi:hypothetical protein
MGMNPRLLILPAFLSLLFVPEASARTLHRSHKHPSRENHSLRSQKAPPELPSPGSPILDDEEQRYAAAKEAAKADPAIQRLKAQSDLVADDGQGRNAAIAYYHALFQKIREADPSLAERADLTEAALMRRLNE